MPRKSTKNKQKTSTKKAVSKTKTKEESVDEKIPKQAQINIGTIGHVDHGKTTLVQALSGVWTDRHSEEIKRGISIKLGYADAILRKCPVCPEPQAYTVEEICPHCGSKTEIIRRISFVDSPGHEALLATMLSGAALMDAAILVVAANEPCPQPQTREHFEALMIAGVDKVIVAQNKIELVSEEEAIENYNQIKNLLKGTPAENAPIIPISAIFKINIDVLIEAIYKYFPIPERDLSKPPRMYIARSFDVNKPGTTPDKLVGGVVGGALSQGVLKIGDEIEIAPGIKQTHFGKITYEPLYSEVVSLRTSLGDVLDEAKPGGLIGVGTKLDPSLTKADALVGNVLGKPGTLPPTRYDMTFEIHFIERHLRSITSRVNEIKRVMKNEVLLLNVGTAATLGVVTDLHGDTVTVSLRKPVCAESNSRIAVSKRIGGRWRLAAYGIIKD